MKFNGLALILALFFYMQVVFSQDIKLSAAANSTELYFPLLKEKRVALVGNHTSLVGNVHLYDTLIQSGINIKEVFCPEHGFRGNVEAGEKVKTQKDSELGIKIISLYGKNYKPKPSDLANIDIVLFDIQDIGVRCYTYLSTLHYVMEACAENGKKLIVLDRPNPNASYVAGPVLDMKYKSFVGLHPVPLVYGMTIGEYALMINGEGWLKNGVKADLIVIPCSHYVHSSVVVLTEKPSPNLPNAQAVYLYPSLVLFEGTSINVGRGTDFPFQVFGSPNMTEYNFSYTPKTKQGNPKPMHADTLCYGLDLQNIVLPDSNSLSLQWLIYAYKHYPEKASFFNRFFYNLSGNAKLIEQIRQGLDEQSIVKSWESDIVKFLAVREKYLLYK
jgi:uncharacterized protein YbbC (DUF1343 family)